MSCYSKSAARAAIHSMPCAQEIRRLTDVSLHSFAPLEKLS